MTMKAFSFFCAGLMAFSQLGCQLLASVRTDSELATGGGTTTSAGGGGSGGTTTSSTNSGGTGGSTGCTGPDDCAPGVCLNGTCVSPKCTPDGDVISAFTSDELLGNVIKADGLIWAADGDRAHLFVLDNDVPRLLGRTVTNDSVEPVSPIVEYMLPQQGLHFSFAAISGGKARVYGRVDEELGYVEFPAQNKKLDGVPQFAAFPSLPAACKAPNFPREAEFDREGGVVHYALECSGQTETNLYIGTETSTPSLVATGGVNDEKLSLRGYVFESSGTHFMIGQNEDLGGPVPVRFGANAAELGAVKALSFSDDPNTISIAASITKSPAGTGVSLLGASISQETNNGTLWGGVVTDYSTLAGVPPVSMKALFGFKEQPIKNTSRVVAAPSGHYFAGSSLDEKSLVLLWFDKDLQTVFSSEGLVLYQSPDAKIIGTSVARVQNRLFAAWVEQANAGGALSVRAHRFLCSY